MVRRHLALSIALASILSLVAGGFVYAAITPEGKVTACVSSKGYVQDAEDNKCPAKSKPVLLDKSTSSPTPSPEPAGGAVSLVHASDPSDVTIPATEAGSDPGAHLASAGTLNVETAGNFEIRTTADLSSTVTCSAGGRPEELPSLAINVVGDGVDLGFNIDIAEHEGLGHVTDLWLEPGTYELTLTRGIMRCESDEGSSTPESGNLTISGIHIRTYAFQS